MISSKKIRSIKKNAVVTLAGQEELFGGNEDLSLVLTEKIIEYNENILILCRELEDTRMLLEVYEERRRKNVRTTM